MKYRKTTLVVIVFLLVLFIPITVFSTTKAIQKALYVENPEHQFKFENKLYFFDNEGKIIGRYYCNKSICNLATTQNEKDESIILKEYTPTMKLEIQPINNKFAFIIDTDDLDDELIYTLYDIENERAMTNYLEVKNYNIGLDENRFIVKNLEGKYGVISLNNSVQLDIPLEYDYIGTIQNINEETNKIVSTSFVVKKGGTWQIISDTASKLSNAFTDQIYNYTKDYVILQNNLTKEKYLTNYNGDRILLNNYSYLDFYENYLIMVDNFHNFSLYNLSTSIETDKHPISNIEDVKIATEDNYIVVTINSEVVERLAIN